MKRREFLQNITTASAAIVFEQSLGCSSLQMMIVKSPKATSNFSETKFNTYHPEKMSSEQVTAAIQKLESRFGLKNEEYALIIDTSLQKL